MKVKVFYPNKHGKIEFTQEELEKLLDEIYDAGYSDGSRYRWSPYIWSSQTYPSNVIDINYSDLGSSINIDDYQPHTFTYTTADGKSYQGTYTLHSDTGV